MKALPTQRSDEIGSVARDISEISKNLRTQISMIAKQRDQFGSVLDNLGEGVFVTDNDGKITYENDSILRILETSSSVKKNIRDLNIKALKNMFENVDKEGRFDYEFQIELKNGDVKWILGSMNRAKTTNEYILVVHDVTQLRENASMRRDFISNLSHELRTPVSVIFANAETLLEGAIDNKKDAKVFSKAIMHNAERISGLVSDLIDLSRIDYGELHLDLKELDVCEIINTVNRSHYTSAKNKGIEIRFDKCNCPHVLGDKAAIERILTNLLDNAIKYSKANNGGEVKITTKVIEDSIKISVKDSGTGISDADRDFIFNRFYRTPEARASQKSGSGLGLAIVKNLAISLGGMQLSATMVNELRTSDSHNVVGYVEGSEMPNEYVLIMGHWDHMGVNPTLEGDQIFNGAVDNATGTAAVMHMAETFSKRQPKRSVVFIGLTAEESGLLGSAYLAENPPFEYGNVIGGLNLDAFPAIGKSKDITIIGFGASELEPILSKHASEEGKYLAPDKSPEAGYFLLVSSK